jgi:hypothetical protein
MRLGLPSYLVLSGILPKSVYLSLVPPMPATRIFNLIYIDLIILVTSGEKFKL